LKGKEDGRSEKRPRLWTRLAQPLLIATCLFLWLVLTPTGHLIQTVVWWTTLTPQEINIGCAILAGIVGLAQFLLFRRPREAEGHERQASG
jgi:hypothetical protein